MARAKRSRTAQGVAAERAVLTQSGVLDDPFARDLLTPFWNLFVRTVGRWPAAARAGLVTRAGLAARVRWHDMQLTRSLDVGINQVVVIGAGYDTRAWRFGRDGVRFFELDDQATQLDKIARAQSPGPTYVAADLRDQSAAVELAAHGLNVSEPAHFIMEGLTMYLNADVFRDQLAGLVDGSAVGSRITLDFHPPTDAGTAKDRRLMTMQRLFRSGSGETFRLLVNRREARELVESSGWSVTETASMRDVARALLPSESELPVDAINQHRTVVAAVNR